MWGSVSYRVGDALDGLAATDGDFDVVYCDVDKYGYPDCWRAWTRTATRRRCLHLRQHPVERQSSEQRTRHGFPRVGEAIREHNQLVAEDSRFVSTLVPIRDGVIVALRVVEPMTTEVTRTQEEWRAQLTPDGDEVSERGYGASL